MSSIQKLGKSERQKNTRQVASVAAFNSDGKILFGLRGDVKRWCLPGGHLEPHEAPAKAAVRELLEETGLRAKSLERLGSAIVGKNGNVQVHCYWADVTGSPSADKDPDAEFIEFRWVNPDDIPEEILVNLYNKQDATLQLLEAQLKTLELSKASLAEIIARTKAVEHHIRRLASSGATEHVFPHPAGGSVLVARDPSKPGGWRATRIDAAGEPLGHVEALDVHQAIKHAHSYGADVMAVQQPFKKFEQDLGQWLAKATQPSDFRKIVEATTAEGPRYVDHRNQMQAHPPELNPVVEHYQNEVTGGDQPMRPRGRFAGGGITRKVVFHTEARPQGDLFVPSRRGMTADFMVKPYHEGVVKRVKAWQKYPIQGWAEMAHQAIYHAAGMGHLHQKVHVAEHEMQHKTGQKSIEPALVVTMEKGLTPAYKLARGDRLIDPQVEHDTAKIALMDFLTNNLDRHCGNLLFNSEQQQPPTDETLPTWVRNHGMHKIHGVMAIDHSRSFQYVNTPQGLDWRRRYGSKAPMKGDSPRGYFFGTPSHRPATSLVLHRPADEQERRDFLESHAKPLFDWWREASPKVREAFDQQVAHIKDSEARDHVRRNFHERLKFLDERARLGIENYGTAWYDDDVPAYRPNEKTDEEQEAERTAAARAQWQKEATARGVQP
jgi:8-oxo-dGTP diphosphatase